jgi:hypothetical protein
MGELFVRESGQIDVGVDMCDGSTVSTGVLNAERVVPQPEKLRALLHDEQVHAGRLDVWAILTRCIVRGPFPRLQHAIVACERCRVLFRDDRAMFATVFLETLPNELGHLEPGKFEVSRYGVEALTSESRQRSEAHPLLMLGDLSRRFELATHRWGSPYRSAVLPLTTAFGLRRTVFDHLTDDLDGGDGWLSHAVPNSPARCPFTLRGETDAKAAATGRWISQ